MKIPHLIALPLVFGNAEGGGSSKDAAPSRGSSGWSLSSVSAGLSWRSFGELNYRGGSRSQDLLIPSQVGGNVLSLPAIGMSNQVGDRTYLNGFVNQDTSTPTTGDTWFWGYDSGNQVEGDFLSFQAEGARSDFSESSRFLGGFSSSDDLRSLSPQIDLVWTPPSTLNLPIDGILTSFWFFGDDVSNRFSTFRANQARDDFRLNFTDRYDISTSQPIIGAPFEGSFGGPGPIIPNLPVDREQVDVLIGGATADFSNSIATSINLDGYSLAVGPTLSGSFAEGWAWQGSAGLTLNLFKWSSRETETLNVSLDGAPATVFEQWRESKSGTDFRLGVYLKGDLIRELPQGWFAQASLQFELADSIDIKIGESEYEFKPRGYALGLSVGRQF